VAGGAGDAAGSAVVTMAPTGPSAVGFRAASLAVIEVGEGPTVGYLHGFLGNPGPHRFLSELAVAGGARRVVAPSLPGFTGSASCPDLRSLHDWVVAVSEVLDVTGLAGAPVVASSIGAMLALEVAAVRPEAFDRLVLVAPLGLWDPADPVADPFGTTLSVQRALLTADPEVTAPFFDDDPSASPAQLVEANVSRYESRTAAASLVWPFAEFGLAGRLHRVTCPVTLVWGAADRLAPPSYLDRFVAALANFVGTHFVAGAGHQAEWDAPAEVASLAAAALAR
jgi:pimeloyl-ACP methyl ester carboxylesterase